MKKLLIVMLVTLLSGVLLAQQESTKKAYMGVVASEVSEALASHLGLNQDKSFILQKVVEESPASHAGLKKFDIILKINNEEVDSTKPLSASVNKFKPEDKINLSIMRAGKVMDVDLILGESVPQLSLAEMKDRINLIMPEPGNNDIQVQILENMEQMKEFQKKIQESFNQQGFIDVEIHKALEEMAKSNKNHFKFNGSISSVMSSSDGEHNITITMKDGNKSALIKDKDDKVIFEGDINTDAELESIPAGVREKVKKMQDNVKIMPGKFH